MFNKTFLACLLELNIRSDIWLQKLSSIFYNRMPAPKIIKIQQLTQVTQLVYIISLSLSQMLERFFYLVCWAKKV